MMFIDVISILCIVLGVIGCITAGVMRFTGEDRNKLFCAWLIAVILRTFVVLGVLICFHDDNLGGFVYGVGTKIPAWATVVALTANWGMLCGFTYKMTGVVERYLLNVLPVMQMKVDKEINAGTISELEANRQRNMLVEWGMFRNILVAVIKYEKYECIIYWAVNIAVNILLIFWQHPLLEILAAGVSAIISLSLFLNIITWWLIFEKVVKRQDVFYE